MGIIAIPALTPEALARSGNVACLVGDDFRILYCNPAWDCFAVENGGGTCVASAVAGSSLLAPVPPSLIAFYLRAFATARSTNDPFAFDYQCSSPEQHREFRMEIFPLSEGFAVIHSLRVQCAHAEGLVQPSTVHSGVGGVITMCCHCRRTRRASEPAVWDWVPDYVRTPPLTVSHGLCPPCREHYYQH